MGATGDFSENSLSGLSANDQAPNLAAALKQSQIDIEIEKGALARTLHDDLGGLLVGAIMDVGWISNHPSLPAELREKLERAQGLLKAAIDLKRELIENLRPTLLENVGLFSTLRWHMKARCEYAAIPYTVSLPAAEQTLSPEVRIGIFRIFQEALKDILATYSAGDLSLRVEITGDALHCHLFYRGAGAALPQPGQMFSSETSMHHRAGQVGGVVRWKKSGRGSHMHLEIPIIH